MNTAVDAGEIDSEELDLLRDATRRVFGASAGARQLAEMELLGLLTAPAQGGLGWRVVEACTVAKEAGRALSPTAWVGTLLAASALAHLGHFDDLIGDLLAGKSSGAVVNGAAATFDPESCQIEGRVAVSGDDRPDVLLVFGLTDSLLVVPVDRATATFVADEDAIDTSRHGLVATLAGAEAVALTTRDVRAEIADAAALLSYADSVGALASTVELVTGYLSGREAFGQPLASFQVLQHRLVDLTVLLESADALLWSAARALAQRSPRAHDLVAAAFRYGADRIPEALDDCIQLSGGIGFTWEWPVHQAMRRALANSTQLAEPVVELTIAPDDDIDPPPVVDEFRAHVRSVISMHAPFITREGHRAPDSPEAEQALRRWYRSMYDNGLMGASWPVEWGGRADHHALQDLVLTEELIRARAPRPIDQVLLASHVLLSFGTPDQKQKYLPRIRSGEDIWCQLFSEPDTGSDLAGIKARATRRSDGTWELAGQKTWTTDGHWSQFGLALLRTGSPSTRHAGITAFIVPMDTAGLHIQPKPTISGALEFNDVFLDGVILAADAVVGEINRGWAVAMSGLEVERFTVGGNVVILELLLDDVIALASMVTVDGTPLLRQPVVADTIQRLRSEVEAAKAYLAGHVQRGLTGQQGEAEAPIAKILYSETYNRIARFGVTLSSQHQPLPEPVADRADRLQDAWLWSRALTISGGSSEIMRNIVAKRRLRLPSAR